MLKNRAMPKNWTRCLMSAGALAGVVLLDEWFAGYIPALPARLAIIFGFALGLERLWPRYAAKEDQPEHQSTEFETTEPATFSSTQMLAEISTALEHLRSVGLLLEISESHRQPLPRAVPLNVELVIKHLDKARRQFAVHERLDVPETRGEPVSIHGAQPLPVSE